MPLDVDDEEEDTAGEIFAGDDDDNDEIVVVTIVDIDEVNDDVAVVVVVMVGTEEVDFDAGDFEEKFISLKSLLAERIDEGLTTDFVVITDDLDGAEMTDLEGLMLGEEVVLATEVTVDFDETKPRATAGKILGEADEDKNALV